MAENYKRMKLGPEKESLAAFDSMLNPFQISLGENSIGLGLKRGEDRFEGITFVASTK